MCQQHWVSGRCSAIQQNFTSWKAWSCAAGWNFFKLLLMFYTEHIFKRSSSLRSWHMQRLYIAVGIVKWTGKWSNSFAHHGVADTCLHASRPAIQANFCQTLVGGWIADLDPGIAVPEPDYLWIIWHIACNIRVSSFLHPGLYLCLLCRALNWISWETLLQMRCAPCAPWSETSRIHSILCYFVYYSIWFQCSVCMSMWDRMNWTWCAVN